MVPIKGVSDNGYNYRVMEVNKLQAGMIKMLKEENTRLKIMVIDRDKIISLQSAKKKKKSEK